MTANRQRFVNSSEAGGCPRIRCMTQAVSQIIPRLSALYFDPSRDAPHRGTLCVMMLLAWIATCDGIVTHGEQELLARIFDAEDETGDLAQVLQIARRGALDDLELACRYVQRKLPRGRKRLLMELAIAVAAQDGKLSVTENHLLQFLADLLGIRPRSLLKMYQALVGRPLPVPGDLHSAAWWASRDAGAMPSEDWDLPQHPAPLPDAATPAPLNHAEAMRLLGLQEGASLEAIHAAYRRAAKRRHPDHFANLGPAAVAVASDLFERVTQAHQLLTRS